MIEYFEMSAELEYIDSYIMLASHYQDIKDYDNMLLWLNKAIDKGSVDAMVNIGCYFRDINNYRTFQNISAIKYSLPDELYNFECFFII